MQSDMIYMYDTDTNIFLVHIIQYMYMYHLASETLAIRDMSE